MAGKPESLSDANQAGVDFLLTELETALTFLDVASTSSINETAARNHANARKAYETVLRLLPKLKPDEARRSAIEGKLAVVKERLQAVG